MCSEIKGNWKKEDVIQVFWFSSNCLKVWYVYATLLEFRAYLCYILLQWLLNPSVVVSGPEKFLYLSSEPGEQSKEKSNSSSVFYSALSYEILAGFMAGKFQKQRQATTNSNKQYNWRRKRLTLPFLPDSGLLLTRRNFNECTSFYTSVFVTVAFLYK